MSTTVTFNGTSYSVPATGDENWSDNLSAYLIAIASGCLQKTGGTFTLTAELDYGATYGIKSAYYKSRGTNPSSTGILRLANAESVAWRNAANSGDITLKVNASDWLQYNSIDLVDKSTAQTLTNKTLTSPSITTPTGIVKGDIGLGNVDNTSDATKDAATATLTNKTITTPLISTPRITSGTASTVPYLDASKDLVSSAVTPTELGYVSGVTSAIQTQLDAKVPKTLTTTTGDMIYASSANTPARLPVGSAGQVIKSVGGIPTWATFSGGINYLSSNPDAEADTSGWATYADAAASSPVDGTGGSPSSTYTRSTSSPLRGAASFLWTKSAANRQGEGFSYDFSIDTSDKAKVIQISFDYLVSSGTYADSDMTIWIYDVTNAALIQPVGYTIQNASVSMKQLATFQSASNSTSYRLIVHTASTSASAYTLQFDNFSVGPQIVTNGAAVTDWVAYTPTFTGFGTATNNESLWRRVGDSVEIQVNFTCGTTTATQARVSLPNGITSNYTTTEIVGVCVRSNATASAVKFFDVLGGAAVNYVLFGLPDTAAGNNALNAANGSSFSTSGDIISLRATLRINGWSSNVQLSSDTDTRVVAGRFSTDTSRTINNTLPTVVYDLVDYDTHGAYNNTTGVYTVPVSGIYTITGSVRTTAAIYNTNQSLDMGLAVNGTVVAWFANWRNFTTSSTGTYTMFTQGATDYKLNAGDTVSVKIYSDLANTTDASSSEFNYWTIHRLSGPSVIAASETVVATYVDSAGAAYAATGVSDALAFNTKEKDSHNAFNGTTGVFTAPVSGNYAVSVINAAYASVGAAATYFDLSVACSGTGVGISVRNYPGTSGSALCTQSVTKNIKMLAGETLTFTKSATYASGSVTRFNGAAWNSVSITKIGNY